MMLICVIICVYIPSQSWITIVAWQRTHNQKLHQKQSVTSSVLCLYSTLAWLHRNLVKMREKSSTGVLILLATSTVDVVMDWRFLILGELSTKGKMSSLTGFVHCFCYKLARFFFFFYNLCDLFTWTILWEFCSLKFLLNRNSPNAFTSKSS